MRRFLVGGNWKMNGSLLAVQQIAGLCSAEVQCEVVVAPPAPYLQQARASFPKSVAIAAQNVSEHEAGAYTGETSVLMLIDLEIEWVIIGHSERRSLYCETNDLVKQKIALALKHNRKIIWCVGETLQQRKDNETEKVLENQLVETCAIIPNWDRIVIAYEPVWAIGTGKVATPQIAQEAHAFIRCLLAQNTSPEIAASVRIIYGGSVTAANCKELAAEADIDGFLVGGASLKADFAEIINARQ